MKIRFVRTGFAQTPVYQGNVRAGVEESVSQQVGLHLVGSGWAVQVDDVVAPDMRNRQHRPGVYKGSPENGKLPGQ